MRQRHKVESLYGKRAIQTRAERRKWKIGPKQSSGVAAAAAVTASVRFMYVIYFAGVDEMRTNVCVFVCAVCTVRRAYSHSKQTNITNFRHQQLPCHGTEVKAKIEREKM